LSRRVVRAVTHWRSLPTEPSRIGLTVLLDNFQDFERLRFAV
jgi:hypothetical protein